VITVKYVVSKSIIQTQKATTIYRHHFSFNIHSIGSRRTVNAGKFVVSKFISYKQQPQYIHSTLFHIVIMAVVVVVNHPSSSSSSLFFWHKCRKCHRSMQTLFMLRGLQALGSIYRQSTSQQHIVTAW